MGEMTKPQQAALRSRDRVQAKVRTAYPYGWDEKRQLIDHAKGFRCVPVVAPSHRTESRTRLVGGMMIG